MPALGVVVIAAIPAANSHSRAHLKGFGCQASRPRRRGHLCDIRAVALASMLAGIAFGRECGFWPPGRGLRLGLTGLAERLKLHQVARV